MKEALVIFIILLVLLMIISVFGGSIRHTPTKFAGVPSSGSAGVPSSVYGAPYGAPWEGFEGPGSAGKAPGAASSPTASSGSVVSSGTVGGTANLASSPSGNAQGSVTAQGGTSTSPAAPDAEKTVEPFGAPEFAPF